MHAVSASAGESFNCIAASEQQSGRLSQNALPGLKSVASATAAWVCATLPRVTVGIDRKGADAVALGEVVGLLRSELRKTGKLEVVGSVDEQKLLEDVRRESQKAGYAEKSACKLGEQLAANSLLQASITRTGKEPKLLLQLFSAEKGCLTQSGIAAWKPQNPDLAVAEAVSDLLARLRTEIQMPGAADRPGPPAGPPALPGKPHPGVENDGTPYW